jgi:hypothetical protein
MNNGPKKDGAVEARGTIHSTPGFQDLWQLHCSELVDKEHNPPEDFVADLNDTDHGYAFKMPIRPDGSFAMKNERNGFTEEYPSRIKDDF